MAFFGPPSSAPLARETPWKAKVNGLSAKAVWKGRLMKEKKMFGKGEKRTASLRVSLWVTRFQPTDNGYIGLFWKTERKGKRKKEKLDCVRGSVGAWRKKKENKNGREKRKDDGGAWWREDREGKVIIIWIAGIVSIHRRLARPIDRRLQLINLFKLDDALIDDHSANTFYNSTVSLGSVFSRSRIERSTLPYFADSRFYWFSIGRDCFGVRRDIALSCYFTFIFTWYIHLQDLGTRGTQVPTEVTL